jgi:hypothetical protein
MPLIVLGVAPVKFVSQVGGSPGNDQCWMLPCVEIEFGLQAVVDLPDGRSDVAIDHRVLALIDTGSDLSHIDEALMTTARPAEASLQSHGINGTAQSKLHPVAFRFPGIGLLIRSNAMPFQRRLIEPYQAILGRNVLLHTRFVHDDTQWISGLEIMYSAT